MKKSLLLLLLFTTLLGANLFGQYITGIFRDIQTPFTAGSRILAENPSYTTLPADQKWLVQLYEDGGDQVVSPLDASGNPTGDDVLVTDVTLNQNSAQYVTLTMVTTNPYVNLLAIRFYPTSGQVMQGERCFLRFFNAHTIAAATKSFAFNTTYLVGTSNFTVEMDNIAGLGEWVTFAAPPVPNPAVLVYPTPNGVTGISFSGINLEWAPGAAPAPDGYKVYFGTDDPPTNLVNGTTQTGTTYPTGPLTPNTTYYWKIVPYIGSSDAVGAEIWSFTTMMAPTYTLTVQSNYPATIWKDGATTGFTTPHDFTEAGTYSVVAPDVVWTPTQYIWDGMDNDLIRFLGVKTPGAATVPVPADGYVYHITWDAIATTYELSWSEPVSGPTPDGFEIFWNGTSQGTTSNYYWNTPAIAEGAYTWKVVPYITDPARSVSRTLEPVRASLSPAASRANPAKGPSTTSVDWHFSIVRDPRPSYTVLVESNPTDADIYVGGVDSGFNTPHTFEMLEGTSAVYTVQKAGYHNWTPASFPVDNIMANTSVNFVGTLQTFTVDVSSVPSDADIYVDGVDSGFNTPHTFTMDYNTNAVYTVQKAGYTWSPTEYVVNNISNDQGIEFAGTLLTYTVDISSTPTGADIYVNGADSGFDTPHTFTMDYNTSATYSVQMTGYSWSPLSAIVNNIMDNQSYHFNGTLLVPGAAVLDSPANGATGLSYSGQLLTYHAGTGNTPTGYKVYFGTDNPPTVMIQNTGATTAPTGPLSASTTYYWYVVAYNGTGDAPASPIWSFTTAATPTYNVTVTTTPEVNATIWVDGAATAFTTPHTFSWVEGTDAVITVVKDHYSFAPVSYTITDLAASGTYDFTASYIPWIMYDVTVTTTPEVNATIWVDGVATAFQTPHTFNWLEGTSATIDVTKDNYSFAPDNYVITNLAASGNYDFASTFIPWIMYDVIVTTTPEVNATIWLDGVATAFTTPHTFSWLEGFAVTIDVVKDHYSFAPDNYVISYLNANTTCNFTSNYIPWIMYDVTVTTTPEVNATIWVDGAATAFTTPHTFNWLEGTDAVITVAKDHYSFAPVSYTITDLAASGTYDFASTYIPWIMYDVTVTTTPEVNATIWVDGAATAFTTPHTFNWLEGTDAVITVAKDHYSFAPVSYTITDLAASGTYDFASTYIPWIMYEVTVTTTPEVNATILVDGSFTAFQTPHTFSWVEGTNATIDVVKPNYAFAPDDYTITNLAASGTYNFTADYVPPSDPVLLYPVDGAANLPYANVHFAWQMTPPPPAGSHFELFYGTTNPPTTGVNVGTAMYYNPGPLMPETTYYWFVRYFNPTGGYTDSAISMFSTGDQPLPVELASFTATVASNQLSVTLTWVTHSETQVLGYNVYRSDNSSMEGSHLVNTALIPAYNTTTTQTYNVTDVEGLEVNHTYYYWLENIDMGGYSTLHGPISATITGQVTPPVTEVSLLGNVYPNPFSIHANSNVNIEVKIATGEQGTVTIYNILGQAVKTYRNLTSAKTSLQWNAKGSASGIYFIKLSTPTVTSTKKLIVAN
jgi:hypothetical protein